jgi:hypothetical protein
VQRAARELGAEALPIVSAIGEMEVPGLIDSVRWDNLAAGCEGEEAEAAIFVEDALGLRSRPAVSRARRVRKGSAALSRPTV